MKKWLYIVTNWSSSVLAFVTSFYVRECRNEKPMLINRGRKNKDNILRLKTWFQHWWERFSAAVWVGTMKEQARWEVELEDFFRILQAQVEYFLKIRDLNCTPGNSPGPGSNNPFMSMFSIGKSLFGGGIPGLSPQTPAQPSVRITVFIDLFEYHSLVHW